MKIFNEDGVKDWVNINPEKLGMTDTPREFIELYPSVDFIPISGGWGYEKEDCVIIEKNDKMNSTVIPFDGYAVEQVFIEKRIYIELINTKHEDYQFHNIKWKMLEQKLIQDDQRYFDYFKYFVTGHMNNDWKSLKKEYEENNFFIDNPEGLEKHNLKNEELLRGYETNYWFDITSFYAV